MLEQEIKDKHKEIKIIREVNNKAENFYKDSVSLGDHAAKAFQERHRSQMTNLETLAESALKATDIFDYIKRQTARYQNWRYMHAGNAFGERLRSYLEKDLQEGPLAQICIKLQIGEKSDEDQQERRHIYLQLIRQFIRQMVIEYEYQTSLEQLKRRQGQQR
jgi:hypothetical protein